MGYTHYWRVNRKGDQKAWLAACVVGAEIVRAVSDPPLAGPHGTGAPEFSDDAFCFNGVDPDGSYETFFMPTQVDPPHETGAWQYDDNGWQFHFCKTEHRPYDVVVTAVLAAMQQEAGLDLMLVTSDGDGEDWLAGLDLAAAVLGRPVGMPPAVASYDVAETHPSLAKHRH